MSAHTERLAWTIRCFAGYLRGGLLPRSPPDGFPVVLGALAGRPWLPPLDPPLDPPPRPPRICGVAIIFLLKGFWVVAQLVYTGM